MSEHRESNVQRLRAAGVLQDRHDLSDHHLGMIEALPESEMQKILSAPAEARSDSDGGPWPPFQYGGEE